MYNRSPRPSFLRSAVSGVAVIALAGGVGYAGMGAAVKFFDAELGCAFPNPFDCIPSTEKDNPQQMVIGGMDVISEDLTGTASYITYGEVRITIDGEQSTADYDNPKWYEDFAGDIDATMYAFPNEGQVLTLLYNPCIKKSDDFSGSTTGVAPAADKNSVGGNPPPGNPTGNLSYEVEFHQAGTAVGTVKSITVNAGILDACFMRIEETKANAAVFDYDDDNQVQFGDAQDITFRWIVRNLATKYASSQACPENVIDMDAVRDDLARTALGDMSAEHPEQANLFAAAYDKGLFEVNIEGPDSRRVMHTAEFNDFVAEISDLDRTLPDAHGQTAGMITPEFGTFVVESCAAKVSDFRVVTTEDQ